MASADTGKHEDPRVAGSAVDPHLHNPTGACLCAVGRSRIHCRGNYRPDRGNTTTLSWPSLDTAATPKK